MAFPARQTTATTSFTSRTAHAINLPSNIVSGDMLIVLFGFDTGNNDATVSWPGGWTELEDVRQGFALGSVAFRVATGSEGSTVEVTSSRSGQSMGIAYRINGAADTPELAFAQGNSNAPDPPSLTPSWGSKDTLWLALYTAGDFTFLGAPSSYTDSIDVDAPSFNHSASAERDLATTTENPGTFSMSGTNGWVAFTVGIEPGGAADTSDQEAGHLFPFMPLQFLQHEIVGY